MVAQLIVLVAVVDRDYDILCDMIYSFHLIKPLPSNYPNIGQLKEVGIHYTCSCPRFNHYHVCKHVLAIALHFKQITVPTRFSCQVSA